MGLDAVSSPASQDWASLLERVFARCEGAYADITLRGYRRDLETFASWCDERDETFMPSTPRIVGAFIDDQVRSYVSVVWRSPSDERRNLRFISF
jgi:site-specific recombinase XerD